MSLDIAKWSFVEILTAYVRANNVCECQLPYIVTNTDCIHFFIFFRRRTLFCSRFKHGQKALASFFSEAQSVSLNVCLSALISCAGYVHTHNTLLSPHWSFVLKCFNSFFFMLQWVFIFGGFHLQKKKGEGNSWASVFTDSSIPQCRRSLNLLRSDCCRQYAGTHFFINVFKTLVIRRGLILGPIMPSNSQYWLSFFVWDLKALDSIKSSFRCLSQSHLWTWKDDAWKWKLCFPSRLSEKWPEREYKLTNIISSHSSMSFGYSRCFTFGGCISKNCLWVNSK